MFVRESRQNAAMSGDQGLSGQGTTIRNALKRCRVAFFGVAFLSAAANLLMFVSPLYMLQVYDRVLTSRSVPTLVALTGLMIACFLIYAFFDGLRSRVVVRGAALLDAQLSGPVQEAIIRIGLMTRDGSKASAPLRDLDSIRAFLSGNGPAAMCDLPWLVVFLFVCWLIHPQIGLLSLIGAVLLAVLAVLNERANWAVMPTMAASAGQRLALAESARRNSETVMALGMGPAMGQRFARVNDAYIQAVARSSDVTNAYGALSKALRLMIQSIILGLGAWLVIKGEMTAGSMTASSIMMGRALAPVESAIANWRSFVAARQSMTRLSTVLAALKEDAPRTSLPRPEKDLLVKDLLVAPPGGKQPVLGGVNFHLTAGQALGIIGPSGSGKSSLARTLTGVWPPRQGTVRLDGAELSQWSRHELGGLMGYLSQDVELFDGSVAENIARLKADVDDADVVAAAKAAGAHELILSLLDGYNTRMGDGGSILSGGQRQRIALARALYGNPFMMVLDEPNSHLDGEGEAVLLGAIERLKQQGCIVIVIAHRRGILKACDQILVLQGGTQKMIGPRDQVMQSLGQTGAAPRSHAGQMQVIQGQAKPAGGVS